MLRGLAPEPTVSGMSRKYAPPVRGGPGQLLVAGASPLRGAVYVGGWLGG